MILAERAARLEAEASAARAQAANTGTYALIARLKLEIEKLRRELFGTRSERKTKLLDQLEMRLEDLEADATEDELAAEAAARSTSVAAFQRQRPARKPFPEHLSRERVVLVTSESCSCCGSRRLVKLGEDITETLEVIPRQWKVIQTVRERFSCRECEAITQPPAPFHVISRGHADPNLLAMVLFEKFGQHQPLNRQSERYGREGIDLPLSTLADHVGACATALRPLHALIERHVMVAERLHGDDTPVPILAKGRPRPVAPGSMSAMTGPSAAPIRRRCCSRCPATARAIIPKSICAASPVSCRPMPIPATTGCSPPTASQSRSRRRCAGATPGESSSCWPISPPAPGGAAMPRRSRRSLMRPSPASTRCSTSSARSTARWRLSASLVAGLEAWMREHRATLSRHAPVAQTMDYMLRRWDGFTRFLDDGRVCLSNSAAERALRGIALGRKAWLFAGSDRGAERAAFMYTLIGTAKLNDVDPQAWLADVLARIADIPQSRLDELLPWNWRHRHETRKAA